MENHTNTELYFHPSDNSSAIFGTSSDAIVEGLHNRDFVDQNDPASTLNADDDPNKIVNTQDQNEIVNPVEKDYKEDASNDPTPVSSEKPKEKKDLLDNNDILEEQDISEEPAPSKSTN